MASDAIYRPPQALAAALSAARSLLNAINAKKQQMMWRQLGQQASATAALSALWDRVNTAVPSRAQLQHLLADGTMFHLLPQTLSRLMVDSKTEQGDPPPSRLAAAPARGAQTGWPNSHPAKQVACLTAILDILCKVIKLMLLPPAAAANAEVRQALDNMLASSICPALCAAVRYYCHTYTQPPPDSSAMQLGGLAAWSMVMLIQTSLAVLDEGTHPGPQLRPAAAALPV